MKQPMAERSGSAAPYVASAFLIGIPVVALLAIPLYSRKEPVLAGFPMFYWWTFLCIALVSAGTWTSYRLIERAKAPVGVQS